MVASFTAPTATTDCHLHTYAATFLRWQSWYSADISGHSIGLREHPRDAADPTGDIDYYLFVDSDADRNQSSSHGYVGTTIIHTAPAITDASSYDANGGAADCHGTAANRNSRARSYRPNQPTVTVGNGNRYGCTAPFRRSNTSHRIKDGDSR